MSEDVIKNLESEIADLTETLERVRSDDVILSPNPAGCRRCYCTKTIVDVGFRPVAVSETRLAGVYIARLCVACVNAWHLHAIAKGQWRELERISHKLKAAIAAGDYDSIDKFDAVGSALEDQLFALARAFVEGDP